MKANVSDQGRAPDVPQRTAGGQPPSQQTKAPAQAGSAAWLVAALLVLSAVPLAASWSVPGFHSGLCPSNR